MSFFSRIIPKLGNEKRKTNSKLSQQVELASVSSLKTAAEDNSVLKNSSSGAFDLEPDSESENRNATLPKPSLDRKDGAMSIFDFLQNHVLFKNLKPSFIKIVAASMQVRQYNNMDFVIKKGQIGRAMFFIQRGQVEAISEDGIRTSHNIYPSFKIM